MSEHLIQRRCAYCSFFIATPLVDDPTRGKCTNPDSDREMVDGTWIPFIRYTDTFRSILSPNNFRSKSIHRNPCFEVNTNLGIQVNEEVEESSTEPSDL